MTIAMVIIAFILAHPFLTILILAGLGVLMGLPDIVEEIYDLRRSNRP